MATIIIEGPDSSGKTTLAHALLGWLGPELGHYVKSPARSIAEWDENWNEWNAQHIDKSHESEKIYILDRTPEISELVYGPVVRKFVRLRDPLSSLLRLKHPDTLIVMTSTDKRYRGVHSDYLNNPIYKHVKEIASAYNLITLLMKYNGYQIGLWDYDKSIVGSIFHRVSSLFQHEGLLPPMDRTGQYYIDKGKETVGE